ncbi:hypothetical protein GGQ74_002321 [Desulfobaculum xiamenense]|uniref:General secretion pathway protein L n=1 Tax=Desulfobaculum xiamenense TaxID=995050 RepID=A0A846QKC2_9BACT|nr:PilN domain-containing protein [Desulfobaculum xiamenense]NJB68648.1 hypothetical protein [Desulfobaculum xiamenense]
MAPKRFYALHFDGDREIWERVDASGVASCEAPTDKPMPPVMAIIPDEHLFFFRPDDITLRKRRAMDAACMLRMEHLFPQPEGTQQRGILRTGQLGAVGFVTGPGLPDFWKQHAAVLDAATVVTSKFMLGCAFAAQNGLESWAIVNGSSPMLLAHEGRLHRASDREEIERRSPVQPPKRIDWREALAAIGPQRELWTELRLPLRQNAGSTNRLRQAVIGFAAVTVAAALVIGVAARDYMTLSTEANAREAALAKLYTDALGPSPGPTPQRSLVSLHASLKGSEVAGFDVLDLLGALSRHAPSGMLIDSFSLAPGKGTLRGTAANYDAVEGFLNALKAETAYAFTLEQATNAPNGVTFSMKVAPQQP